MELYLRSVEFIFLLLPMTTVDVYHVERDLLKLTQLVRKPRRLSLVIASRMGHLL